MFHCFNISKHISISVLFFVTSVSCFVFFARFENSCVSGESEFSKKFRGDFPGGMDEKD